MESATASDQCPPVGRPCLALVQLARVESQLQAERAARRRLEYVLREELAQELAGISLLVTALRRQSRAAPTADRELQQIADLLADSIGRCCEARPPQPARR